MSASSLIVHSPPDAELIERFQAGEYGVFEELYSRHRDRIHGVVASMITSREDAVYEPAVLVVKNGKLELFGDGDMSE